jgi:uncharacterized membrane protein YoaK (UPF0700 family)
MEDKKNIAYISLCLAFAAGFCDAATFTAAEELFSAHVTGNFVVFAYDLIRGAEAKSWLKLLSFPVFTLAVIAAGWVAPRLKSGYTLLLVEALILVLTGVLDFAFDRPGTTWAAAMPYVIVLAMGIQNAFGRLYATAAYAPTTMMTGNVTQLTLDIAKILMPGIWNSDRRPAFGKQFIVIGGFLAGCLAGAFLAAHFGLWTVVLPGVLLLLLFVI